MVGAGRYYALAVGRAVHYSIASPRCQRPVKPEAGPEVDGLRLQPHAEQLLPGSPSG